MVPYELRTCNTSGRKKQEKSRERAVMAAEDSSVRPVLVTGFGPFHQHTVNASWAAVQELGVQDASSRAVPLVTKEVSMLSTSVVSCKVPALCRQAGRSSRK